MNSQDYDHAALANFFSSYFHEDWPCEAETPTQVVQAYLGTASPSDAARLRAAIIGFLARERDNAALEKKLMPELGCYYLPSADGLSARDWLLSVADLLTTKAEG
jgi:hypothetical protein